MGYESKPHTLTSLSNNGERGFFVPFPIVGADAARKGSGWGFSNFIYLYPEPFLWLMLIKRLP